MTLKPTSARYMPSLAERAAVRVAALRSQKAEATLQVVKPYVPHQPSPKQKAFLELDAQEALYGGAAGGGKSDALIMGALQYVDHPRYSAVLMRRHEVDLLKDGAIQDRAKQWFQGTAAKWDTKLNGYRFPTYDSNPGAAISFGQLANIGDRDKWKGPEFQYVGIDELTEWTEGDYLFMFSRLRSLKGGVPTRMRAGTNPGGEGHDWIFARFVQYAKQLGTGVLYNEWRLTGREGSPFFESPATPQVVEMAREMGVEAQGAFFVPAFAEDNPALNQVEYKLNLARLDPVEFAWFALGDWTAIPSGRYFRREWFANVVDVEPPGVFWIRYWDLAGTEPKTTAEKEEAAKGPAWTAGVKLGIRMLRGGDFQLVIGHVCRDRLEPPGVESFVHSRAESDGRRVQIVIEQEPGSSGKAVIIGYQRRVLFGFTVHGDKVTGPKELFWQALAAFAKAGGVLLVRGEWNEAFIKELITLPQGKKDQADAAARGYAWLIGDEGKRLYRMAALANMS